MLSAAGFQLKGSGWYATDFKNSGSKPAAKSTAEGGDKAAAKSDSSAPKSDSSEGTSDKKDAGSKPGGNTNSKSEAAA
jgi:predicted nucleic acid-binding Zn ribbon protein